LIERDHPERGRLLRHDVDRILDRAGRELEQLSLEANLERLPTRGSRHNVLLALFTVAAYHAVVERGIERRYAAELVADVGWKLYAKMVTVPRLVARLLCRDPQRQIQLILRIFMFYPFGAPGRPGYEVKAWSEADRFCTFWTHCPPHQAVRDTIERHGDGGELEAFRMSWCSYDWALTYALLDGGFQEKGHYERPHTMSAGDDVCDMCWYARPPAGESNRSSRA
jgi:hypothetical protein